MYFGNLLVSQYKEMPEKKINPVVREVKLLSKTLFYFPPNPKSG